jgi:uncharacterized protein YcaQ
MLNQCSQFADSVRALLLTTWRRIILRSILRSTYGWLRAVREFVQSPTIGSAAVGWSLLDQAESGLGARPHDGTIAAFGAIAAFDPITRDKRRCRRLLV